MKLRNWIILFLFFLISTLPFWIKWYGERLPLRIQKLQITGLRALSALDLKKTAGLKEGSPLFGKWVEGAISRLSLHPRIEKVTVRRTPMGKVQISVAERKAVAMVNFDSLYYVDEHGKILGKAQKNAPEALDLPVITGKWKNFPKDEIREIAPGLELLKILSKEGIASSTVSEIHRDSQQGWMVYRLGSGVRIVFGYDQFEVKAKRLKRVIGDFFKKEASIDEIDLDFDSRAVIKLKGFS